MPATTKGAWRLQEVRDAVLCGEWAKYNGSEDSGQLWIWGYDGNNQLGPAGTGLTCSSPVQVPGDQWVEQKQTLFATLARKTDGTLWAWGYGGNGELGTGTTPSFQQSPLQVPGTFWCSLGSGGYNGFGIKTDGTLWSWGNNVCGQLGQNNLIPRNSPVQIPGTQWCAAGTTQGCSAFAVKNDGTLWAWGNNSTASGGFLGLNDANIPRSSPTQIPGNQWLEVDSLRYSHVARKTDGTLWMWGCNTNGQLGDGTTIIRSSPVQVPGFWVCASTSANHTGGVKTDGTLWMWGNNAWGQLGQSDFVHRSSPVQVPGTNWLSINVGNSATLATKNDSTLWGWGCNTTTYTLLGDGTSINRSSPVQIPGTQWADPHLNCYNGVARKSYTPPPFYDVPGKHLWAWGTNGVGQIGDNTTINRVSPVNIPGAQWSCSSAGLYFNVALKTDGTLWAWGCNASGRLGDNTVIHRSSPVQIPGTSWNCFVTSTGTTLATKSDGTLWGWGEGFIIGNNSNINRSSPVQIPGTSWCNVGIGFATASALKTDGTLWIWGTGGNGEMGINLITNPATGTAYWSSPVQIPGTSWSDISGGWSFNAALKTDGSLWTWGDNDTGQLGHNSTIQRSSPVQIPGTWVEVCAGCKFMHARKGDGTLWAWGKNDSVGELGDNSTIVRSSPVQIPGTSWSSLSDRDARMQHTGARKTDGTLWLWGNNTGGRLGDGTSIPRSSPIQIPGICWLNSSIGGAMTLATKCFTG